MKNREKREKHEKTRFLGISRKCPFSHVLGCSNFHRNRAFFQGKGL